MSARHDDHQTFDELAVGWALHALEPEDEAVFGAHLATCPRCARTVAETAEVMSALAGDLPAAEPSERLRERLRDAVERTEQLPPPAGAEPAPPAPPALPPVPPAPPGGRRRTDVPGAGPTAAGSTAAGSTAAGRRATGFPDYTSPVPGPGADPRSVWRRVLPNALVAAAVAAILALGTWTVVLGSARDDAQAVATRQAEVIDALLEPGRAAIAPVVDTEGQDVLATVVARDGRVQVVTDGLRVNDSSDSTYVVWGIAGDGPVALGTFDVISPQTDLRTVESAPTGSDAYDAYAISIEPGRQAPAEPSEVVADGQVTS
ncbi:Putative zinc-finger [Geodermatophilus saharensis]|uniref:Regulator of SigK n=1 Tax=Geodermatophilus saharensis TaxID=1137994 RepID=A0A239G061_9ACTN|nr:anti-sigma factor [Geodermatophilus saharensis]SNS62509.1 Putative zinc-finger [Geodermatophilus saharensis]